MVQNFPASAGDMYLILALAQTVKHLPTMWETQVQSLGQEDLLEKEMATHSSTLAWKIPWTKRGTQKSGNDLLIDLEGSACAHTPLNKPCLQLPRWRWKLGWRRWALPFAQTLSDCLDVDLEALRCPYIERRGRWADGYSESNSSGPA